MKFLKCSMGIEKEENSKHLQNKAFVSGTCTTQNNVSSLTFRHCNFSKQVKTFLKPLVQIYLVAPKQPTCPNLRGGGLQPHPQPPSPYLWLSRLILYQRSFCMLSIGILYWVIIEKNTLFTHIQNIFF